LAKIVRENINLLRSQDNLLTRGTPVVSFWPMREKWKKYGPAWTTLGTDGDVEKLPSGKWRMPAILRLTYIVCHDGRVCQLATVIRQQQILQAPRLDKLYEQARFCLPGRVA
jgi:hypothetical protein